MPDKIRLGVICAGGFTKGRMLPNFQKLPDVNVVVVCNRHLESVQSPASSTSPTPPTTTRPSSSAAMWTRCSSVHHPICTRMRSWERWTPEHVLCQTRIALTPEEVRRWPTPPRQPRSVA